MEALGLVETKGLTSSIIAADIALKSANVTLLNVEKIKGGYVTVQLEGGVGDIKAAVDAAVNVIQSFGTLVSSHVIPRMHKETTLLVNAKKGRKDDTPTNKLSEDDKVEKQLNEIKEQEGSKQLDAIIKSNEELNDQKLEGMTQKSKTEQESTKSQQNEKLILDKRRKLEAMTVKELRELVRKENAMKDNTSRIKYVRKEELINSILNKNK